MADREKVISGLMHHREKCSINGDICPYFIDQDECVRKLCDDVLELLKAEETRRQNMIRSWQMIKYSVLETANNNADAGNKDYCNLLTWVANMMNQQEAKWDD